MPDIEVLSCRSSFSIIFQSVASLFHRLRKRRPRGCVFRSAEDGDEPVGEEFREELSVVDFRDLVFFIEANIELFIFQWTHVQLSDLDKNID